MSPTRTSTTRTPTPCARSISRSRTIAAWTSACCRRTMESCWRANADESWRLAMGTEQKVAEHYTHGALLKTILDALKQMGKDPERFAAKDLATGDELHLGWLPATIALAKDLG